jgi:hypothetical protein
MSKQLVNFITCESSAPFLAHLAKGHVSGSPDKILEGAIQGPFHQSLVAIGPVVSEEKI